MTGAPTYLNRCHHRKITPVKLPPEEEDVILHPCRVHPVDGYMERLRRYKSVAPFGQVRECLVLMRSLHDVPCIKMESLRSVFVNGTVCARERLRLSL